ncbi:MAG TPA: transglycosylase domain-containing protein [Candidatus Methanoperedens sp.]|nr:transglycosylase domain-containing protein [Candidatus Methanoperedens sp.]
MARSASDTPPRRRGCLGRTLRCALALAAVAGALVAGWWLVSHGLAIRRLASGPSGTVFLDAGGQEWFPLDPRRLDVPLARVAPALQQAVIAAEDQRFRGHWGIDPFAVVRALWHNLRRGEAVEGASTITQQLARTLFLSRERTVSRKLREAALALLLEALLPKERILELYLNRVPLGALHGVEAFSRETFGKAAADLSLGEAAMVAGIIRAPSALGPRAHYDAALAGARRVLARLRDEGLITPQQERAALAERPRLAAGPPPGDARAGWAQDYLRRAFRDQVGDEDPPGWRVRTTLPSGMQRAAEAALAGGIARLRRPGLQAALVALDPEDGGILAIVGGADYGKSTYNRAALASRQPGSAFKPFVYAAALEGGDSPVTRVPDVRSQAFAEERERAGAWVADNHPAAFVTYREALARSDNAAALAVQRRVGTAQVAALARRAGLPEQPAVASLALGTGAATPLELTAAFAPFVNGGFAVSPHAIASVADQRGATVLRDAGARRAVLAPAAAWQVLSMLREVVESGTGAGARDIGIPAAGKTGTTDDYHDAWFVGFVPGMAAGVWVGFDRPAPIGEEAYAARIAVPIWADFARRAARLRPPGAFAAPAGIREVALCAVSRAVPTDGCPTYLEQFKEGDAVPEGICPLHPGSLRQRIGRAIGGLVERIRRLFGGR